MQTQEVLSVLKSAAAELSAYSSQPSTPREGAPAAEAPAVATAPANAHVLLQISALHKAFLSLSEAFLQEMEQRQEERQEQQGALQAVRRDCADRVQAEARQLAAVDGQQAHAHAVLAQRCSALEEEVARLRLQLEGQQTEAAEALQQQLEAAVARVEGGAAAAAQAAVQRWAAEALPPLLQPMQEAVGATAELASSVAAEAGGLAASLQQLAERAGCLEAAHENHEQRLGLAEARAMSGGSAGADSAAQLERLAQQVHALQAGHSQLDEAVQGLRHRAARAAGTPSPLRATASSWAPQQQPDLPDLQSLSLAAAELPAVQQQLAAVADQQAQQARTTDEVVQSVLADVRSLARHTRALDKEVRALRKEAGQAQAALLQSCAAFSKALGVPSPLGPFTSFPPQV